MLRKQARHETLTDPEHALISTQGIVQAARIGHIVQVDGSGPIHSGHRDGVGGPGTDVVPSLSLGDAPVVMSDLSAMGVNKLWSLVRMPPRCRLTSAMVDAVVVRSPSSVDTDRLAPAAEATPDAVAVAEVLETRRSGRSDARVGQ